jgi:hypothetical protein
LHNIMQFVTFEVCARRIGVPACAVELQIAIANAADKIAPAVPRGRMMRFPYVGTIIAARGSAGNAPPRAGGTLPTPLTR